MVEDLALQHVAVQEQPGASAPVDTPFRSGTRYTRAMETPVHPDVVLKALRKVVAAIEGVGHKPVAIGAVARRTWGAKQEPQSVELLLPTGEPQRAGILSAARGEGLQQVPGGSPLSLRYTDAKLGGAADVALVEAATPLHQRVIERAQRGPALAVQMLVATCEDLILMAAASGTPADRESIVQLLRHNAGRIDAPYIKREAEAQGVFDRVKSAWQEAKQQG
jgi:hypothetical protein